MTPVLGSGLPSIFLAVASFISTFLGSSHSPGFVFGFIGLIVGLLTPDLNKNHLRLLPAPSFGSILCTVALAIALAASLFSGQFWRSPGDHTLQRYELLVGKNFDRSVELTSQNEAVALRGADQVVVLDRLCVGVAFVRSGQPNNSSKTPHLSGKDNNLSICVRIVNITDQIFAFPGLGPGGHHPDALRIFLSDSAGGRYQIKDNGPSADGAGRISEAIIYPASSLDVILTYNKTLADVRALTLRLPASVFGGSGAITFSIPTSMPGS